MRKDLKNDTGEWSQEEWVVLRLIAEGEKEIRAGKSHSLDSVIKESDSIQGHG